MRPLAASVLAAEALVVFFATLVAANVAGGPDPGTAWLVGGGSAVLCLLLCGLPFLLIIGESNQAQFDVLHLPQQGLPRLTLLPARPCRKDACRVQAIQCIRQRLIAKI